MHFSYKPHAKGFTIVELLIVIVVLGILATITVVAFSGVQQRARQSKLLSDIAIIKKEMEVYKSRNGDYPYCPSAGSWSNGNECAYNAPNNSQSIRNQLIADGASDLPTYSFAYIHVNTPGQYESWGMLVDPNSAPDYKGVTACKFGNKMAAWWYGSAPECS